MEHSIKSDLITIDPYNRYSIACECVYYIIAGWTPLWAYDKIPASAHLLIH